MSLVALAAMPSLFAVKTTGKEPIVNYQVLFSPDDKIADELISLIGMEKRSIKAAVYCLMHRGIANALIDAHERGVNVEVISFPFLFGTQLFPVDKVKEERRLNSANL
jgi:hypothetical protein